MVKFGLEDYPGITQTRMFFLKQIQPIIWQMFEEPRSSNAATLIAGIQIIMIILSIAILWISSYTFAHHVVLEMNSEKVNLLYNKTEDFDNFKNTSKVNITVISFRVLENEISSWLMSLDYVTFAWFVVDITVRMTVAPDKVAFFRNLDNLIDIFATSWLIIGSILKLYINSFILESSQVIRALRLFRLLSYHSGLQVIITSIKR
jgi:potassium voltage-gated channel Shaw-related subfamily C protein 2